MKLKIRDNKYLIIMTRDVQDQEFRDMDMLREKLNLMK